MDPTRLIALVIFTLGASSFGALFAFWVRQTARGLRSAAPDQRWKTLRAAELFGGALSLVCAAWFVVSALDTLIVLTPGVPRWPLRTLTLVMAYLFPPMLIQGAYLDTAARRELWRQGAPPSRAWRAAVPLAYLVSLSILSFFLAVFFSPLDVPGAANAIPPTIGLLFTATAAYGIASSQTFKKKKESVGERRSRRSYVGLFLVFAALCAALILPSGEKLSRSLLFQTLLQSIPLAFLFIGTYFESRFQFFDIFVKRGTSLLLTIVLLTVAFAVLLPWLRRVDFGWSEPWIYAILFLPLVMFLPWLYKALGQWLDSVWLGRRFTTVDAVKYFLGRTQGATSEDELLREAEGALSEIFSAPARIDLGGAEKPEALPFEVAHEQPLRIRQSLFEVIEVGHRSASRTPSDAGVGPERSAAGAPARLAPHDPKRSTAGCPSTTESTGQIEGTDAAPAWIGMIRMGRRANHMPFFSEDLALVGSLSHVLMSVLESVRLQSKKQEQERLAQELTLHASRSELKALRAQINPHFLFNALNAIAGLIHKDPRRADRTVEQLAEVFRYTLRRSESEWTKLEDELEFVRAYLEVEKARFGERLHIALLVDEDAGAVRVPTMMLQTLVENAVKHGISAVRGPGRIEITTRKSGGQLLLEVADTGPGMGAGIDDPERQGEGYGLRNVQERLTGYYGDAARLSAARDAARGMTVVSLEIPLFTEDPERNGRTVSDGGIVTPVSMPEGTGPSGDPGGASMKEPPAGSSSTRLPRTGPPAADLPRRPDDGARRR